MDDLITRYGLVGVFFGAAIEGDITLILAGITGALGLLNLPLGLAVGVAGAVSGDVLWYAVGRWRSSAIRSSLLYQRAEPVVERLVGRLGPWQIVVSRFLYGTRGATMLFWGARQLSLKRFLFYDLVGCTLWAAILGTLGYVGGHSAKALMGEVVRVEMWLLSAVLAFLLLLAIRRWLRRRQART